MLSALALIALVASPSAVPRLTVTNEVRRPTLFDPPSDSPASDARTAWARLGLTGTFGLGRFASALSSSFARWSLSIGLEAQTGTHIEPSAAPVSGGEGLLVARIGQGLYLGRPPMPRAELFPYREYVAAKPKLSPTGVQIGIEGTLFLTPCFGIHLNISGGGAMYGGLSLIYRPKP